jgi:hypothetical protein
LKVNYNHIKFIFLPVFAIILFYGWGVSGHKIINRKIVLSFPVSMNPFLYWRDSLAAHGSDADYRKSADPNESPRHYIDIDNYPEFLTTGRIPQTLDSLIMLHGYTFVIDNGILPFAIIATVDSVKNYFLSHNWQMAMLKAADLGHYTGDGHNPLHITRNYNGQFTNQYGIHTRYETTMINRDSANIIYGGDSIEYINNINQFVFDFIYRNYPYVDSVLRADSIAYSVAGYYNNTYYQFLWNLAGNFSTLLFKNSSNFTASLIYTAWVNAGSPVPVGIEPVANVPINFALYQNYPNPFNSGTIVEFSVSEISPVTIMIYDISGREVGTLTNKIYLAGKYSLKLEMNNNPSGIYFCKMTANEFQDTKKIILLK